MMIAQCDTPARPYVTWLLSIAMVAAYFWILILGQNDPFSVVKIYDTYALYPNQIDGIKRAITSLSSLFIHATWTHLGMNLFIFLITAPSLERHVGPVIFTLIYAGAGIVGNLAEITLDPVINVPLVGASTAIAGITGAVAILFARPNTPRSQLENRAFLTAVVTCIFIVLPLPDWATTVERQAQIAQIGHITGLIAGMIAATLLRFKFS